MSLFEEDNEFIEGNENANDTEYVENNQSDSIDYIQESPNPAPCTYVYTPDGAVVCAESLVSVPAPESAAGTENETESAESVEEPNEETESSDSELSEENDLNEITLLTDIKEAFASFMETETEYQNSKITLDNQIIDTLSSIELYVSTFFVLWFLGWVWAQLNNWRRNTKV